jgi:transposase
VPTSLEVHLILDNAAIHKTKLMGDWLRHRPRFHLHFTPTSSSWLNLVECWFALLSRRRLKRGVFRGTAELEKAIRASIKENNAQPKPFVWTRSAEEILANVGRFCKRTSNSDH